MTSEVGKFNSNDLIASLDVESLFAKIFWNKLLKA